MCFHPHVQTFLVHRLFCKISRASTPSSARCPTWAPSAKKRRRKPCGRWDLSTATGCETIRRIDRNKGERKIWKKNPKKKSKPIKKGYEEATKQLNQSRINNKNYKAFSQRICWSALWGAKGRWCSASTKCRCRVGRPKDVQHRYILVIYVAPIGLTIFACFLKKSSDLLLDFQLGTIFVVTCSTVCSLLKTHVFSHFHRRPPSQVRLDLLPERVTDLFFLLAASTAELQHFTQLGFRVVDSDSDGAPLAEDGRSPRSTSSSTGSSSSEPVLLMCAIYKLGDGDWRIGSMNVTCVLDFKITSVVLVVVAVVAVVVVCFLIWNAALQIEELSPRHWFPTWLAAGFSEAGTARALQLQSQHRNSTVQSTVKQSQKSNERNKLVLHRSLGLHPKNHLQNCFFISKTFQFRTVFRCPTNSFCLHWLQQGCGVTLF